MMKCWLNLKITFKGLMRNGKLWLETLDKNYWGVSAMTCCKLLQDLNVVYEELQQNVNADSDTRSRIDTCGAVTKMIVDSA